MTYNNIEDSLTEGSPIYLLRFTSLTRNYNYTNNPDALNVGGFVYTYQPFELDDLIQTTVSGGDQIFAVRLPYNTTFATEFNIQTSTNPISIRIDKYHTNDPDLEVVTHYFGYVRNVERTEDIFTVNCVDPISALNTPLHKNFYQVTCNHVLYDSTCRAEFADFSGAVIVSAVSDNQYDITLESIFNTEDDYMIGGALRHVTTGDRRRIVFQNGLVMGINYPFKSIAVGDVLSLSAGCDHTFTTCRDKFDNDQNYGGVPYIPLREIF